jgi:hypothetical protein
MLSLEPLLRKKVQLLHDRIDESLHTRLPINLSDVHFALSNE